MQAHMREMMSELRSCNEAREELVSELKRPDQMLVWMRERDRMTFGRIAEELGAITRVALTEDSMRMRYSRLVKDRIGPPVADIPEGTQ
jgi:hypothetical protein